VGHAAICRSSEAWELRIARDERPFYPPGDSVDRLSGLADGAERAGLAPARDVGDRLAAGVRILGHELAHALGVTYDSHSRAEAEVIVDTVTFVVCACAGLGTGGESISYVASWGESGSLGAVREAAETIDAIARTGVPGRSGGASSRAGHTGQKPHTAHRRRAPQPRPLSSSERLGTRLEADDVTRRHSLG
jgi:hypothetical protein